jgi:hypothetical protein
MLAPAVIDHPNLQVFPEMKNLIFPATRKEGFSLGVVSSGLIEASIYKELLYGIGFSQVLETCISSYSF